MNSITIETAAGQTQFAPGAETDVYLDWQLDEDPEAIELPGRLEHARQGRHGPGCGGDGPDRLPRRLRQPADDAHTPPCARTRSPAGSSRCSGGWSALPSPPAPPPARRSPSLPKARKSNSCSPTPEPAIDDESPRQPLPCRSRPDAAVPFSDRQLGRTAQPNRSTGPDAEPSSDHTAAARPR